MMDLNLTDVSKVTQVADAITIPLSQPIRHAVASTVLSLAQIQRASNKDHSLSTFLPNHLLILPPHPQGIQSPSHEFLQYFLVLALLANKAAESLNCSSILAAQGSESDDTGDVALWLGQGDYGPGKEENVLKLLKLTPWLEQGAQVSKVELLVSQFMLPSTLSGSPQTPEVRSLAEKISEMTNKHCFRVSSPTTPSLVVFFLLGYLAGRETTGWGCLVGMGIWSDE